MVKVFLFRKGISGRNDSSNIDTFGRNWCILTAYYGEIAIGYKKFVEEGNFSIEVNPASREGKVFYDLDDLIVISHN